MTWPARSRVAPLVHVGLARLLARHLDGGPHEPGRRCAADPLAARKVVLARYARNRRLADALQQWAFSAMRGSPGAKTYYQQLRARNIGHQAALRQLANRLVGILHGCLKTHTRYDEHTAWAHLRTAVA